MPQYDPKLLYLQIKYVGDRFAKGMLGPYGTDEKNVRRAYREIVPNKGRLEYARIVRGDGSIVAPIT